MFLLDYLRNLFFGKAQFERLDFRSALSDFGVVFEVKPFPTIGDLMVEMETHGCLIDDRRDHFRDPMDPQSEVWIMGSDRLLEEVYRRGKWQSLHSFLLDLEISRSSSKDKDLHKRLYQARRCYRRLKRREGRGR